VEANGFSVPLVNPDPWEKPEYVLDNVVENVHGVVKVGYVSLERYLLSPHRPLLCPQRDKVIVVSERVFHKLFDVTSQGKELLFEGAYGYRHVIRCWMVIESVGNKFEKVCMTEVNVKLIDSVLGIAESRVSLCDGLFIKFLWLKVVK
jgi:hypothetical protein